MDKDDKKRKLLPFEQAKENLRRFVENMELLESTSLLVEAIESFDSLSKTERKVIDSTVDLTISSLSLVLESSGAKWN